MSPYASGKEHFELRKVQVGWLDRDPITNEQVWYAVTIVTKKGKEFKDVNPAKVLFCLDLFLDMSWDIIVSSRYRMLELLDSLIMEFQPCTAIGDNLYMV